VSALTNTDEPQFVSTGEVARLLGVTRRTVCGGCRRGDIPSVRVGNEYLIPRAYLKRAITGRP